MNQESLQSLPHAGEMIFKGDDRTLGYRSDIVLEGDPDALYRARDLRDLREILVACDRQGIPVTFCGARTSLTGASVALSGLLVATEKMDRILDICEEGTRTVAVAEPGIVLADFQERLRGEGWFYPPDPTSRDQALLGATVATNASGEDSLLYGPTRCHVRALKILLTSGEEITLTRPDGSRPVREKNCAGFYLNGDLIDLFIGSEGTLGFVSQVTVDLIRETPFFSGVAFFPSVLSAVRFAASAVMKRELKPRCLELMDGNSLALLKGEGPLGGRKEGEVALYFKQEYRSDAERDETLGRWMAAIGSHLREESAATLADEVIVAVDPKGQREIREERAKIPRMINEEAARYRAEGGGKVATDWWVPPARIVEALSGAIEDARALKLPVYLFGHIGNGHPHVNYIARSAAERERAMAAIVEQCRRAVDLGGGVSGEHGIGKTRRHLLPLQHSGKTIQRMREVKDRFDPRWILGRGNLFDPG